jgi:hypothetical protein
MTECGAHLLGFFPNLVKWYLTTTLGFVVFKHVAAMADAILATDAVR